MTSLQILEHLAKEFASAPEHVRSTLEMIDAGLSAPFIGRVRRAETGGLPEMVVRRLDRVRKELEELDRRRGTILRMLDGSPSALPQDLERVQKCMDRFDLEDLFVPHRRPEPEVQLALDRGLGRLAELLIASVPREPAAASSEPAPPNGAVPPSAEAADAPDEPASHEPEPDAVDPALEEHASVADAEAHAHAELEPPVHEMSAADESHEDAEEAEDAEDLAHAPVVLHDKVELTPALARLCAPFVDPDKGIHTEIEALEGAMRILSDGLGRNARLRGSMRRLFRKHGVLSVRATVDESKLGRHRSLLKVKQPLRQLQGHRLLAIRQAQKERAVTTVLALDPEKALPKVRAVLGKHSHPDCTSVLDVVARQALERRLLPVVEADVRLELKERADDESLRFLAHHLRQVLLTPPLGPQPVIGIDVSAKGDWILMAVDARGEPGAASQLIEVGEKDAAALGAELVAAFEALGMPRPRNLAIGHGKLARTGLLKLRPALRAAGLDAHAFIVNDSGLSAYANSELGRKELAAFSVPQRMAIGIGRRLQDPLAEILKVDPRHLGLGAEQGLVSKANVRRMFDDVIESCVALVGCDISTASATMLARLPGLDAATAARLVARRAERPFESREELRGEGLLTEAQWTSAIACLRVSGSSEPLDATNLHPQQYDLARRVIEATGASVEEALRRPGATKGLRRVDFVVDEFTWRDLMREIAHPGRDVRPRLFPPRLLDPNTDPVTLTANRVVEGTVSNVASFGAFVDLGLPQDGMVHISQISDRYVRDARELLSIGQTVRARIGDGSSQRLALSLKNVPAEERPPRPQREQRGGGDRGDRGGERGRARGGRGRTDGRRGRGPQVDEPAAPVRAARSRRDGLVTGARGERGGRGGGGGGGNWQGGGRGRGRPRDEDAPYRPEDLATPKAAFNPFATFFQGAGRPLAGSGGKPAAKEPPPAEKAPEPEPE